VSVPTSGAVGVEAVPAERATFFCGKLWFWLPIVPLVALDLVSKHLVFAFMAARRHVQYEVFDWADKVKFSLVEVTNKGTIWGLGQSLHLPLVVLRFFAIAFDRVLRVAYPEAAPHAAVRARRDPRGRDRQPLGQPDQPRAEPDWGRRGA
jgi:hypothetical protein